MKTKIFKLYFRSLPATVFAAALLLIVIEGEACTTFVIKTGDELVFGRNLDWKTGLGLVIVNKRNIEKTSLVDPPEKPVTWVSKYGSITFNQVGKEFPYGGINETGLVVEQMSLRQTEYPARDGRPIACEVQWIQFQLDNCSTVDEVIANDAAIRIGQAETRLHFLVADRLGNMAAIEFLRGEMVVHAGDELRVTALANSGYDDSMIHMERNNGVPDDMPNFSIYRFATAARMIEEYKNKAPKPIVDYALDILRAVGHETTRWSIVYDIKNLTIYFRTDNNPTVKIINIKSFDYDCDTPAKMIEMDIAEAGVIDKKFVDYDPETNLRIVRDTFEVFRRDRFLESVTDAQLKQYTDLLNAYTCIE
jgi:choloylglycine hydrolase